MDTKKRQNTLLRQITKKKGGKKRIHKSTRGVQRRDQVKTERGNDFPKRLREGHASGGSIIALTKQAKKRRIKIQKYTATRGGIRRQTKKKPEKEERGIKKPKYEKRENVLIKSQWHAVTPAKNEPTEPKHLQVKREKPGKLKGEKRNKFCHRDKPHR